MDAEQKSLWRARWIDSIAELTNLQLQISMWLDEENTNPHWSFVEFMCCYFDDTLVGLSYQYFIDEGLVSKQEYTCIKQWHEAVDVYDSPSDDDYDSKAVLNDSKWREIVALGVIAKEQLIKLLPPEEASQLRS